MEVPNSGRPDPGRVARASIPGVSGLGTQRPGVVRVRSPGRRCEVEMAGRGRKCYRTRTQRDRTSKKERRQDPGNSPATGPPATPWWKVLEPPAAGRNLRIQDPEIPFWPDRPWIFGPTSRPILGALSLPLAIARYVGPCILGHPYRKFKPNSQGITALWIDARIHPICRVTLSNVASPNFDALFLGEFPRSPVSPIETTV